MLWCEKGFWRRGLARVLVKAAAVDRGADVGPGENDSGRESCEQGVVRFDGLGTGSVG